MTHHTATSDPKRNPAPIEDEIAKLTKRLGLDTTVTARPGKPWMTHSEFDERDKAACERLSREGRERTPHAESAAHQIMTARARWVATHSSEEGFVPWRRFPCPGTMMIDDDDLRSNGAVLSAQCDECGFQIGIQRSAYDPNYAQHQRLRLSGLPDRFLGRRMEPVPGQNDARLLFREYVQQWAKPYIGDDGNARGDAANPGPPLRLPAPALYGEPGLGKSHLLCSVAETLIKMHGTDVQYWSLAALLAKVREGFNDAAPNEVKNGAHLAWERAKSVECLVLDDIGAERPTEWAQEQVQILVDHRYQSELPILLASNMPPGQWPDIFGARTASRLLGMTFPTEVTGVDLRQNPPKPTSFNAGEAA